MDISPDALKIAKQNAELNQVQINLFESNVFSNVSKKYDLIISNPPYISSSEYQTLDEEIRFYEPKQALIAGEQGIDFYQTILTNAEAYLCAQGCIILEIGAEQAGKIKELAIKNDFKEIKIEKDLNGFDRVMIIRR